MKEWVYFVADVGRIKVGYSRNVDQRIRDIGQYLERPLVVIGVIEGGLNVERAIHGKLSEHRLRGEWFRDNAEVRLCLDTIIRSGLAAAGILPGPHVPLRTASAHEESGPVLPKLCRLMWPDDATVELMALSGAPETVVRGWLTECEEFPLIVRLAVAALVMQWMGDRPCSVREMIAEEHRQDDQRGVA